MSLATAAWARLTADATLAALVGTYRGDPAIIVVDEGAMPENVGTPYVLLLGNPTDEPSDTKTTTGRDQTLLVGIYDAANGSTLDVDAIGERIRTLLHRLPDGLADGAFLAEVAGPFMVPLEDEDFYGRGLRVRVVSSD